MINCNFQIEYGDHFSNVLCLDCQHRIKFGYRLREDLINAFQVKPIKTVEVYQIIATSDDGTDVKCVKADSEHESEHEEFVEITEVDENFELNDSSEQIFIETAKQLDDEEEEYFDENDDDDDDNKDPLDAVSFLLKKKDLFKNDGKANKSVNRRSHKCQVCDKTFMRKSNLVDHLRLHANLRLYKCEYCAKEFVQAGNYRSHLRVNK